MSNSAADTVPGRPEVSGATRLAAVIGDPVRHSLSPAIHNAAFEAVGLDWIYLALPVAAGAGSGAIESMRNLGIEGLSVTMPHKADVAGAADDLTEAAARLGVANCLFRDGDRIVGDSTDGDGFVAAYELEFGTSIEGAEVAVLGAGGAAASIVEALGRAGVADIAVVNRSPERAAAAAAMALRGRVGGLRSVPGADVVVNATAVGMAGGPAPDGLPVPPDALREGQHVVDIVYQPRVTPFLRSAAERGARTGGGLGMLVHQAARAFELWTGVNAPVDAMTAAVERGSVAA